jgi:hypothetical protein
MANTVLSKKRWLEYKDAILQEGGHATATANRLGIRPSNLLEILRDVGLYGWYKDVRRRLSTRYYVCDLEVSMSYVKHDLGYLTEIDPSKAISIILAVAEKSTIMKQVAKELGLSLITAHRYVKKLGIRDEIRDLLSKNKDTPEYKEDRNKRKRRVPLNEYVYEKTKGMKKIA